ncbi:MAG: hypothetical protein ACMUEM_00480 [Flavobacteriales bacterium AspAUS03]
MKAISAQWHSEMVLLDQLVIQEFLEQYVNTLIKDHPRGEMTTALWYVFVVRFFAFPQTQSVEEARWKEFDQTDDIFVF